MNPNEASGRERELPTSETTVETVEAIAEPASERTTEATSEPTSEPTSDARPESLPDPVTAALQADPPTATLRTDHPATAPLVAEPVTTPSPAPADEVRYELDPVPPAAAFPPAPTTTDADLPGPRGPRMRTIVLGLVLLVISGTGLARMLTGARIDDTVVLLTLLIVAGVLLLGGGVASAAREARMGRRG